MGFSLDGQNNRDGVGRPSADLARHGKGEIDEFGIQFKRFGDGPAQFGPTEFEWSDFVVGERDLWANGWVGTADAGCGTVRVCNEPVGTCRGQSARGRSG